MEAFTDVCTHRPLSTTDASEIRLVALHPGEWDDPLVCTLKHVSLDEDPTYDAVSYVWGNPNDVYDILLDDMSYPVAANLYQVLHRLRDYHRWHPKDEDEPPEPLLLWIDALCINQADKVERSAQVQRMTQIYTKATKVFACVAEIEPCKEDLIEKLFSIPWEPLKRDEFREQHGEDGMEDDDRSVQSSTGPANWFSWKELAERVEGDPSELKKCMLELCGEAFFSRIWIVQELTLSQHLENIIVYGPHSTNTIFLLELLMALRYDHVQSGLDFLEISKITANAFAMVSGAYGFITAPGMTKADIARHLIEVIRDTQHFHATEPRDKIYALLGLINKELLPANLLPSYEEPLGNVYQAWTKFLLENTGDLSIIEGSLVQDPSVPTWVASLSLGTDRKTTPADPANVRFSNNEKILYVKGQLISFVLAAYSPPALTVITSSDSLSEEQKAVILTQTREMEANLVRHVRADTDHGESYLPYLFDLMVRQCEKRFAHGEEDMTLMRELTQAYHQIIVNDGAWTAAGIDVLLALQQILNNHWVVFSDCAVFRVQVGRGPIRPADEIYLLQGSSGLTVLRRDEEQDEFLRIAYCDVGTDHEQWSQLELAVNGELDMNLGGRGAFRPQLGVIEIPIS